jgi:DNA repair ATPase RecN
MNLGSDLIILMGGVLTCLFIISTFYLKNSLQKLESVSRLESDLKNSLNRLEEIARDVKDLLSNHSGMSEKMESLRERVSDLESFEKEARDKTHEILTKLNQLEADIRNLKE